MGALRQSPDPRLFILIAGVCWIFLSGYINDTHTYVPGPDGKCGYGNAPQKTRQRFRRVAVRNANAQRGRQAPRKCSPKDVNAFAKLTEHCSLGKILAPLHDLNVHFRGFEERI